MEALVDALLAGPRGRRFCLAVAQGGEWQPDDELHTLLFWATYHLERQHGGGVTLVGYPVGEPKPEPSAGDVARALAAVDLPVIDDVALLEALDGTATSARYWQEPDGEDLLLRDPVFRDPLDRIARAIAAAAGAEWLQAGAADEQWEVEWEAPESPVPPAAEVLRARGDEVVATERADRSSLDRPVDTSAGGEWWSTPPWGLLVSTRRVGPHGPVGLWAVEDSHGWDVAAVRRVTGAADGRVFEITGAAAWAELCRRYPMDVSATKRSDWFATTGRDGSWVMPDWRAVAHEYDAVHLTTAGWLSAAGTAIPVDDERASVIAGWGPDQTVRLTDPRPALGPVQTWQRDDDDLRWYDVTADVTPGGRAG